MAEPPPSSSSGGGASAADEATLFLSNPLKLTSTEWQTWALQHMYRGLPRQPDAREATCMRLLRARQRATEQQQQLAPTLQPCAELTIVAARYRIAVALDMSPSMCAPHVDGAKMLFECVWDGLQRLLLGLCQPFTLPGDAPGEIYEVRPELFVTVLAEGTSDTEPGAAAPSTYVLAQGIQLSPGSVQSALQHLRWHMARYENHLAQLLARRGVRSPLGDAAQPDLNLQGAVRAAMFALELLPRDSVPVIVVFSDGCSGLADPVGTLDKGVLRELNQLDITCIPVAVGATRNGASLYTELGCVPDYDVLKCLALSTGGQFAYCDDFPELANVTLRDDDNLEDLSTLAAPLSAGFSTLELASPVRRAALLPPPVSSRVLRRVVASDVPAPNWYHQLALLRSATFAQPTKTARFDLLHRLGRTRPHDRPSERSVLPASNLGVSLPSSDSLFPWDETAPPPPVMEFTAKYKEYYLNLDLDNLLTARLRDGFRIQNVFLSGSGASAKLHIKLTFLVETNVEVEYRVKATWQVDAGTVAGSASNGTPAQAQTDKSKSPRVEIDVVSWPAFFYYFTQQKPPTGVTGQLLFARTQRLHDFLNILLETDRFLGHLATFNTVPAHFSIPSRLRPDTLTVAEVFDPQIRHIAHVQMFPADRSQRNDMAFVTYWQTIASMLGHKLSRWFDEEVKHFVLRSARADERTKPAVMDAAPAQGGLRRVARDKLVAFFKSWSTFVLAKNIFVKFIFEDAASERPSAFCLVLLTSSAVESLMSARLAFFRADVVAKQRVILELRLALDTISDLVITCTKPVTHFLVDLSRTTHATGNGSSSSGLRLVVGYVGVAGRDAASLIAEQYLRKTTWSFFGNIDMALLTLPGKMSVVSLALRLLRAKRLEQGFVEVTDPEAERIVFYREFVVATSIADSLRAAWPSARERRAVAVMSAQYVLAVDLLQQTLTVELWVEPQVSAAVADLSRALRETLIAEDRRIVRELYSFDYLHLLARTRGASMERVPATLVDIAVLLPLHRCVYDSFKLIAEQAATAGAGLSAGLGAGASTLGSSNVVSSTTTPLIGASAISSSKSSPLTLGTPMFSQVADDMADSRAPHIRLGTIGQLSPHHQANLVLCAFLEKSIQTRTHCEISLQRMAGRVTEQALHAILRRMDTFRPPQDKSQPRSATEPRGGAAAGSAGGVASHSFSLRVSPRGALAHPETLFATRLKDCKCYVLLHDDESFLLVLLPTYTNLLQQYMQSDGGADTASAPITPSTSLQAMPVASSVGRGLRGTPFAPALSVFVFDCYRHQIHAITTERPVPSSAGGRTDESVSASAASSRPSSITSRGSSSLSSTLHRRAGAGGDDDDDDDGDDDAHEDAATASSAAADEPLVELSSFSRRFIRMVRQVHEACFVRGVYAATLQRQAVSQSDLRLALDLCHESAVEVDLTHMLNVATLGRMGLLGDHFNPPNRDAVASSFRSVLNQSFVPIVEVDMHDRLFLCFSYFPNARSTSVAGGAGLTALDSTSTTSQTDDAASGSSGSLPRRELSHLELIEASEYPMFLRLEVTFTKPMKEMSDPNDTESSYACFSVDTVPLSFRSHRRDKDDSPEIDFASPSIRALPAPFLPAGGTQARLRLVAFILAPYQRVENTTKDKMYGMQSYFDIARHYETAEDTPFGSPPIEPQFGFSYRVSLPPPAADPLQALTDGQRDALLATGERVQRLLAREMLSMLLSLSAPNDATVKHVHEQLRHHAAASRWVTHIARNLHFVYATKGGALFVDLITSAAVPLPLRFMRHDDIVYACEGPRALTAYDAPLDGTTEDAQPRGLPPFWLTLEVHQGRMQLYFFGAWLSEGQQRNVLESVTVAFDQLVLRVNRTLLLHKLFETHRCTSLLNVAVDAPTPADSRSEHSPDEDGDDAQTDQFTPGQFECECVFSTVFPVSWRLQAMQAMRFVSSQLQGFAVTNRSNMFVYRSRDGPVFYMTMSVVEQPAPAPEEKEAVAKSAEIRLDVYGLERPGEEITGQFVQLIESKLAKHTLDALSTLLVRNATLKLTPADVDFVQPDGQPATVQRFLPLPDSLAGDPHLFLLYLKQNLTQFLHVLATTLDGETVARRFVRAPTNGASDELAVLQPGEFVFTYVSVQTRTPSVVEAAVGQGIALVSVNVVDAQGQVRLSFPSDATPSVKLSRAARAQAVVETMRLLEDDRALAAAPSTYRLRVDVWMRGTVNADVLADRVFLSVKQSAADLLVERLTTPVYDEDAGMSREPPSRESGSRLTSPSLSRRASTPAVPPVAYEDEDGTKASALVHEFVMPCRAVLDGSMRLGTPSVERQWLRLKVPRWMHDDLICELRDSLREVHGAFSSLVLKCLGDASWRLAHPQRHFTSAAAADASAPGAADATAGGTAPVAPVLTPQSNSTNMILFGLDSLGSSYGLCANPEGDQAEADFASTLSGRLMSHARRAEQQQRTMIDEPLDLSSMSRRSSVSNVTATRPTTDVLLFPDFVASADAKMTVQRSCFVMVDVSVHQLGFTLYNVNRLLMDQLALGLQKVLSWVNLRVYLLESIFHQKMGLFLHAPAEPAPIALMFKPKVTATSVATAVGPGVAVVISGSGTAAGASSGAGTGGATGSAAGSGVASAGSPGAAGSPMAQTPRAASSDAVGQTSAQQSRLRPETLDNILHNPFPARTLRPTVPSSGSSSSVLGATTGAVDKDRESLSGLSRRSDSTGPGDVAAAAQQRANEVHQRRLFRMPPSVTASVMSTQQPQQPTTPSSAAATAASDRERDRRLDRELKRHRRRRLADLRVVLRDGYPKVPMHVAPYARMPDLVARHGLQLREVRLQEIEAARSEEVYQIVYNRWTATEKDKVQTSDLAVLLRCGRLIHTARSPLLFSKLRDSVFIRSGNSYICTLPSFHRSNSVTKMDAAEAAVVVASSAAAAVPSGPALSNALAGDGKVRMPRAGGGGGGGGGDASGAPTPAALSPSTSSASLGGSASMVPTVSSTVTVRATEDDVLQQWFDEMLATFQREYIGYLNSIGLVDVLTTPTSDSLSPFVVSDTVSTVAPSAYLAKGFKAGVLLIEMTLEGMFVSMNMYALHPRSSVQTAEEREQHKHNNSRESNMKVFNEESTKLKNFMHVKSFTYDFHLRYLYKTMVSLAASSGAPSSALDFVDVLKAFVRYNQEPARYARNRIADGVATMADRGSVTSSMLMTYMIKSGAQHGFQPLKHRNVNVALFMSSKTPDFRLGELAGTPRSLSPSNSIDSLGAPHASDSDGYRYLLVAYVNDGAAEGNAGTADLDQSLALHFFVAMVSLDNIYPLLTTPSRPGLTSVAHQRQALASLTSPRPAEITLAEVTANAQNRLERMMADARAHYDRDQQWNRLVTGQSGVGKAGLSLAEYQTLKALCRSRAFEQIDPTLGPFLATLRPCNEALDFLLKRFQPSREFRELPNKTIVVFFNKQSPDLFVEATLTLPSKAPPTATATAAGSPAAQAFPSSQFAALTQAPGSSPPPEARVPPGGLLTLAAVRRERLTRPNGGPSQRELEDRHVGAIVNALTYFMWSKLLR